MAVIDPDSRPAPNVAASEPRETSAPVSTNGFRARLEGLSLFDLIQMECLARTRRIVRVASAGRVGYLYFQGGEIFHATTKNLVGDRAALEMLEWTDGNFEPCNIAWPERGSVKMSWQNLLIGAATSKDELNAGKLVRLPSRRASPMDEEDVTSDAEELQPGAAAEAMVNSLRDEPFPKGVQRAVRVDSVGNVLAGSGETEELAGFAAYAARVGDLIGESLGLGRLAALDLTLVGARSILCIEDGGKVMVVEAKNGDDLAEVARGAGL
jgi:hypothetical protein